LEMRVADEHAEHQLDAVEHVVGGDVLGPFLPDQLAGTNSPVSAARRPASAVPLWGLGMVLQ
jgi:hypothetical protein